MANPNIVNPTSVVANTSLVRLADTSATQLVSNAASSNKVFLIDAIYVSNVDGSVAADITLDIFESATNSGTATKIAHTVSVPADAVLVPVMRDGSITLKENMSIYATASAGGDLHVVTNWKELS